MDATSNPYPNGLNPPASTDPTNTPTKSQPVPSNTKHLKEPAPKIWDYFIKLDGGDPKDLRATCNYCEKNNNKNNK